MREKTGDRCVSTVRLRTSGLIDLLCREAVIERSASQPLHDLSGLGAQQTRTLLHEKATIGTRRANRAPIGRLTSIDDLVHRKPEHRREWVVLEHGVAIEVNGRCVRRFAVAITCEMTLERGPHSVGILHVTRGLLVERAAKDVEREGDDCVAMERVRKRRGISARSKLGAIERHVRVAARGEIL